MASEGHLIGVFCGIDGRVQCCLIPHGAREANVLLWTLMCATSGPLALYVGQIEDGLHVSYELLDCH
jgi:hypothetical protein